MKQFNWRFAFLIGLTGVVLNTFWTIFNTYVPILLQTGHPLWEGASTNSNISGFALGPTVAYFIMTWDNIIHMFLTPWAGAKSDGTWNRFGRRMPWMLIGLPIALIGFVLIPIATSIAGIILFITLTNIGTGIYRAPLRAWMGDFFKPDDRAKAEAPVHLLGGLAVVIAAIIGGRLFDTVSPTAPFFLTALVVLIAAIPLYIWVKEDKEIGIQKQSDQPKTQEDTVSTVTSVFEMLSKMRLPENRSILYAFLATFAFHMAHAAYQAGVSGFAVFNVGVTPGRVGQFVGIAGIVYLVLALPSGLLANRYGPRRIMVIGMIIYGINALAVPFYATSEGTLLLSFLIGGSAWAFVFVNSLPLVMNTDKNNNFGVFAGLYYLAFQAASIVGPLLSGAMIEITGTQSVMWLVAGGGMILAILALSGVTERDFEEVEAVLLAD
ncbi:MAG: MFS transporter [Chloroflexota bacterium]